MLRPSLSAGIGKRQSKIKSSKKIQYSVISHLFRCYKKVAGTRFFTPCFVFPAVLRSWNILRFTFQSHSLFRPVWITAFKIKLYLGRVSKVLPLQEDLTGLGLSATNRTEQPGSNEKPIRHCWISSFHGILNHKKTDNHQHYPFILLMLMLNI